MSGHEEAEQESDAIVAAARPLFAGHHPKIQGLALAELTAIWLAGHPSDVHVELMEMQTDATYELAAIMRKQRKVKP